MADPNKETQKEFFNEFESAGAIGPQSSKFTARRAPILSLSLEQMIITCIALLLLCLVSFMMGFWRGKSIKNSDSDIFKPVSRLADTVHANHSGKAVVEITPVAASKVTESKHVANPIQKPYTIQVAAYRSKDRALKEASHLKHRGYLVNIIQSGEFHLVCVGQYQNRKDARKDHLALRVTYKDSYLRRF